MNFNELFGKGGTVVVTVGWCVLLCFIYL